MTAVVHHGPPGSFKSFGTVQRAMIPALEKGRTVVTNIRGFESLERIEEAMGCKLPASAEIIFVEADSAKGFDAMARFFHWVPKGALIAIDETQRVWSKKRNRDLKKFDLVLTDADGELRSEESIKRDCPLWDGDYDRPETVENAFDQHRHYNWDIYLTTPNIAKVHDEVRTVVEVAYRHRGMGAILPWWKNKWKEFTHDAETSGKQLSHYMGSPKTYKADQRVFACYQSTKTGKAKGTSEARPLYRDPKLQMVFGAIFLILFWFGYLFVDFLDTSPLLNGPPPTGDKASVKGRSEAGAGSRRHDDRSDVTQTDIAGQFDRLASPAAPSSGSASHSTQLQKVASVATDPLAEYFSPQYDVRLAAVLYVPGREKLYYRVTVYENGTRVDEFTQDEIQAYGYQEHYGSAGLRLQRNDVVYLVRPFIARRLSPVEPVDVRAPMPTVATKLSASHM
ncbi:zonular occludens toxin family protein [Pontibacterium sp.]|uniref:zonular occludens toxin family protein n=1 Tax=Pontibacterium sp. TaxID=2036026 RepID=UPI003568B486